MKLPCRLDIIKFANVVLAILAIVTAAEQTASAQQLLTNGNFETGTFAGWTVVNQAGGTGNYFIGTPGTPTPGPGAHATASNPSGGSFYAVSNMSGAGSHVLYQSFVVPASARILTLTFQMFVNIQAGATATPASLSYLTIPNQQVRVDILNSIASPFSVTGGVVSNLYDGTDSGTKPNPYTSYTFNLSSLDATPGTYYIRFAEVDNQGVLNDGVDNVSLIAISPFASGGLTSNQQSVLAPINQGLNNGSGNANFLALFNGLGNASGSQASLGAALDSLSPQKLQVFRNIAFDNFGFNATQIDDHTASLRYGQGGFDTSGLQVLDSSMPSMMSQIKGRLLAWNPAPASGGLLSDTTIPMFGGVRMSDSKDMKEISPVTDQNRWSAFISGNVILADISHDVDVAYSHYTTGGVTAGADYRLDNNWAVGGLFGYGHTSADLDNNGSTARVDSYSPGIYATYADHGWYANGLFAYDYNSYGESRAIPVMGGSTHGSTTGNQYDVNLDGGYEFRSGNLTFGPTAALQYVHLDINNFTESGAGALDINSQNADSLRSRLGGEMRYNWLWYGGKAIATPHLSASWQHECLDNSSGITSQFDGAGLGSFTVNTTRPDRDSAFIDAGLDTQWNSAFNLFIDYQVQAGQSNFFAQSIEGGAKVSF